MFESARARLKAKEEGLGIKTYTGPERVSIATEQDVLAAVKRVIQDLNMDILREGEDVPSDLDQKVFGSLPQNIYDRLQFIADVCADYLERDAADDHFVNHEERRIFKSEHKSKYGYIFKEKFERNRLRISASTTIVSGIMFLRHLLNGDRYAWGKEKPQPVPRAEEFEALLTKYKHFFDSLESIKKNYDSLSIPGKLAIVDQVSAMAHGFLDIVTAAEAKAKAKAA